MIFEQLNFQEVIAGLTILSISCIAIFVLLNGAEHSEPETIDNSSLQDFKKEFNLSQEKKDCEQLNGSIVNYSYGENNSETFVGCKL